MKAGWKTKMLGDLGAAKRDSAQILGGIEYELWSVPSFANDDPEIALGSEIGSAKLRVRPNDVLICKINPRINRVWLVRHPVNGLDQIASTEWLVFRRNSDAELLPSWLIHFVSAPKFREWIVSEVSGATGSHTRAKADGILQQEIPVPPLPEQQRIVCILDQAFAAIATAKANAEKNLQNARALFESHLQAVFTQSGNAWVKKPLESVADILNGYSFKSSDFSNNEGVKCIKITNVGVREFICESGSFLPREFATKYGGVSVRQGSIVLALTRTIISGGLKVAVVPAEYDGALLNQRVASILPHPKQLSASFLFSYLSTKAVIDYVKERVNTLMQPNLSIKDLNSMPVPIPLVHEQNRISDQLSSLREETLRLEAIYQQKLAALDELKKSLLHQAFSGQL